MLFENSIARQKTKKVSYSLTFSSSLQPSISSFNPSTIGDHIQLPPQTTQTNNIINICTHILYYFTPRGNDSDKYF